MSSLDKNQAMSLLVKNTMSEYEKNFLSDIKALDNSSFCTIHCKKIDNVLIDIYTYVLKQKFKDYSINKNSVPIALFAMGSYGRMHMSAYSDIDLMILYEQVDGFNIKEIIEDILHIAWDSRLNISHRVHELEDIQSIMKKDNTIQTAILESRLIYGSINLNTKFQDMIDLLIASNQRELILDKVSEYNAIDVNREVSMECDLKYGIGTLRDISMLLWIAKYSLGADSIKDLYFKKNILTQNEYNQIKKAINLLLIVRANLHIAFRKKQNVLSLEFFPDLLESPNKSRKILPQFELSKKLFYSMSTIYKISHTYISKLSSPYLDIYNNSDSKNITQNLIEINNRVYIDFKKIEKNTVDILQEILDAPDKNMVFDGSIFYAISKITKEEFISKIDNPNTIQALISRKNLYCILRLFYDTQTLGFAFNAFKPIMYIGQFDGYHQYPIGFHSLSVLWNLENIEDDFVLSVFDTLSDSEKNLLKFCAIFHDLGKGRNGDHSLIGVYIFAKNAKKNNFSSDDIKIGKTLIKYHTLMSQTAYTSDIHEQQVLTSFCSAVPSKKLIDMLFVLTYADNLGTRKNSLTSHKKYLLRELYTLSIGCLVNKNILKYEIVRRRKEEALKKDTDFISLSKKQKTSILNIPSSLLFIKHSKKDILNIAKKSFDVKEFTYEIQNEDFLSIEVIRYIPFNLGYLLNRLSFLNLAHLDIFKIFDDIKYFKINFSTRIPSDNIDTLKYDILNSFDMSKKINTSIKIDKKNILLEKNHTDTLAKMTIKGKNQKGFFAYISRVLDDLNIDIRSAKIHTVHNRIQDILLIEKNKNFDLYINEAIEILSKDNVAS